MNPAKLLRFPALMAALSLSLPTGALMAQSMTIVPAGCLGMSLTASELPIWTTSPFNFDVAAIPAGRVLNTLWFSLSSTGVPIDLAFLGAPGCTTLMAEPILFAFNPIPVGTTDSFNSVLGWPPVYNGANWIGVFTTWQAVSFVPAINPSWMVFSNMVELVGG